MIEDFKIGFRHYDWNDFSNSRKQFWEVLDRISFNESSNLNVLEGNHSLKYEFKPYFCKKTSGELDNELSSIEDDLRSWISKQAGFYFFFWEILGVRTLVICITQRLKRIRLVLRWSDYKSAHHGSGNVISGDLGKGTQFTYFIKSLLPDFEKLLLASRDEDFEDFARDSKTIFRTINLEVS